MKCDKNWEDAQSYRVSAFFDIKERVGDSKVLLGLSGGVDSTVAAYCYIK